MVKHKTILDFFAYMNDINFQYVVLRNFDALPDSVSMGGHNDLDLLVYDFEHWKELFPEAKPTHNFPRVQFEMYIGDTKVYIDARYLGDDYYPLEFEKAILETREYNPKGFWTPNPIHFRLALAYHVVHHKNENTYQKYLGNIPVKELFEALKMSSIGWVEPKDPTVGRFNPYWSGATSIVTKEGDVIIKKQTNYGAYNLIDNEKRILPLVFESNHFPKLMGDRIDAIVIEDCGIPLTLENLPSNWREQCIEIVNDLKKYKVIHRDIRPDNLLVKDGIIKLIDFGWSRLESDPEDEPPSCLGFPYKSSEGFSDVFSMRKIIKEVEYQLEERIQDANTRH